MFLVADDNRIFARSLRRILGEECRTASTPDEAIELVAQRQPRVVVMDVRFSGCVDGIESIPLIRLLSPLTQVVVCTGYYSEADAARALRYGAYTYIEKIYTEELLAVIIAAGVYASELFPQPSP